MLATRTALAILCAAVCSAAGAAPANHEPQHCQPFTPACLSLAHTYENQSIAGWLASEKLDGVRAYWTGSALISRQGNTFHAPEFTQHFPPFALDGELWIGRGRFEQTAGQLKRRNFTGITYQIFDVPNAEGGLTARLQVLENWLKAHPNPNINIIAQTPVTGIEQARRLLAQIEAQGGEGIMLREPTSAYQTGRTAHLLKLKTSQDAECTVTAHIQGQGKHENRLGALRCRLPDGRLIKIGSGFTDAERENPPAVGSIITYRYRGLTNTGRPRFPTYLRQRIDP